jgi:hypothetical protein
MTAAVDHSVRPLIGALEAVWVLIREQHPELPAATFVVGTGQEGLKRPKMGSWAPERWQVHQREQRVGEVFIAGEFLAQGVDELLDTELHEAAHALNRARKVKDCTRQGRYHNAKFAATAGELGLRVERDDRHGFVTRGVLPEHAPRWARARELLQAALELHRVVPPPRPKKPRKQGAAGEGGEGEGEGEGTGAGTGGRKVRLVCRCDKPRRLWVPASTASAGPITCGVCGHDFEVREDAAPAAAEDAALRPGAPFEALCAAIPPALRRVVDELAIAGPEPFVGSGGPGLRWRWTRGSVTRSRYPHPALEVAPFAHDAPVAVAGRLWRFSANTATVSDTGAGGVGGGAATFEEACERCVAFLREERDPKHIPRKARAARLAG